MSQPSTAPQRKRVEFTEASIRRRQLVSRLFRYFALGATFFGLAMLVIFLTRLTQDVVRWFDDTPKEVRKKNVEIEAARERLKDAEKARDEKLAEMNSQMEEDLKAAKDEAARKAIREYYEKEVKPQVIANEAKTIPELRKEADANFRPNTSSWAIFWHFISSGQAPENRPQDAGILYGLLGTVFLMLITIIIALPIGVGAAIYLEEYRSTSRLAQIIQININNLAGVPSVMFGILGAFLFVDAVFRPVEAELERPARTTEYQDRYDKLHAAGKITEKPRDPAHLVRLVIDPEGTLEDINARYAKLVSEGKVPARPRTEADRIRAVLDTDNRLAPYLEKFDALVKDGTIDRLVKEKKIAAPATSPFDVPEQVLIAEGKSSDAITKELDWLKPLKEADARASRIAIDARLLTPPNYFIQALASLFSWLGLSVAARNLLGGGLTLALLVLPILIVASQEAIRAVPVSLRHGSLALGATQWQTIWKVVLPSALPGILTGTILAMCRAMGEAAPLVLFGATMYIDQWPSLFQRFTVLPMQIFVWSDRVNELWRHNAALASFILMIVLLGLNAVAIYFRQRSQSKTRY
jgi:phosphate transport system permease protein